MATSKKCLRGLQDLRTFSGKVGPSSASSTAYLRIACLEMEKERRGREKESATHRVRNIDERFREIEAEKATLLTAIVEREQSRSAAAGDPPPASPGRSRGGFKLKY